MLDIVCPLSELYTFSYVGSGSVLYVFGCILGANTVQSNFNNIQFFWLLTKSILYVKLYLFLNLMFTSILWFGTSALYFKVTVMTMY